MRKALLVGINDYSFGPLSGCINDANRMYNILLRNEDGSPNFQCKKLVSSEITITRPLLKKCIGDLFSNDVDVALLYFSGHGDLNSFGGYLVTQDAAKYDEGVSMAEVVELANTSNIKEVIIMLDCCHSGQLGNLKEAGNHVTLREGVSLLSASRANQSAVEYGGSGIFTSLIYDALDGGAANVIGDVTVASTYSYVDQMLGAWEQRPMYKANVSKLLPLRKCKSVVALPILRRLHEYFPTEDYELRLDPSFEPTEEPRNIKNEKVFSDLQKFRAARLVYPVGEEHMYYAALNSKSCKLTPMGKFYRKLAEGGKI